MYDQYYVWDEPVPYKGLKIYPITMRNYLYFNSLVSCLTLNKNQQVGDDIKRIAKVIKMSYLDYLYYLASEENDEFPWTMLMYLFTIVLHDQKFEFRMDDDGKIFFIIEGVDEIYTAQDFEEIKRIIMEQNDIPIEEEILNPELEEDLKRAKELKKRLSNMNSATFEELIVIVLMYTGLDKNTIKDMTVRTFNKLIDRMSVFEDYKVYKGAEVSGMVTFNKPITHWMSKIIKEGYYDDVKLDKNAMDDKLKDVAKT